MPTVRMTLKRGRTLLTASEFHISDKMSDDDLFAIERAITANTDLQCWIEVLPDPAPTMTVERCFEDGTKETLTGVPKRVVDFFTHNRKWVHREPEAKDVGPWVIRYDPQPGRGMTRSGWRDSGQGITLNPTEARQFVDRSVADEWVNVEFDGWKPGVVQLLSEASLRAPADPKKPPMPAPGNLIIQKGNESSPIYLASNPGDDDDTADWFPLWTIDRTLAARFYTKEQAAQAAEKAGMTDHRVEEFDKPPEKKPKLSDGVWVIQVSFSGDPNGKTGYLSMFGRSTKASLAIWFPSREAAEEQINRFPKEEGVTLTALKHLEGGIPMK